MNEEVNVKKIVMSAASLLGLVLAVSALSVQGPPKSQAQTDWIAHSLKEMQTVKVNMTRADLLKIFTKTVLNAPPLAVGMDDRSCGRDRCPSKC
jgi:hypothetical protein